MPRPPAISNFKYCASCDAYKRKDTAYKGSNATCNDCQPKPNYLQRRHHDAVAVLGNECKKCHKPYKPGTGNLHTMKIPSAPNHDPNLRTQYARDCAIIDDPEWGNTHYILLCVPCRPKFEEMT